MPNTLLQSESSDTVTPSQLYKWANENIQPNQWWLSLDFVTQENPVTAVEIDEIVTHGGYSDIRALHVSQAEIENPQWLKVAADVKNTSNECNTKNALTSDVIVAKLIFIVIILSIVSIPFLFLPLWILSLWIGVLIYSGFFGFFAWKMDKFKITKKIGKIESNLMNVAFLLIALPIFYYLFGLFFVKTPSDFFNRGSVKSIIFPKEETKKITNNTDREYTITGNSFTGFIRSDDWEKSFELASDTEAFSRFFLQCVMSNRATLFKAGETVILVEVDGLFADKVRIRRKGETVSYWTVGNSIR